MVVLDSGAVALYRPRALKMAVKSLEVAIDYENEIVETLTRRQGQRPQ